MKTNKEGLTFKEWVCAAGVAVIDDGSCGVQPYSTSYEIAILDNGHQIAAGFIEKKRRLVRRTTRFYSRKIRKAWTNGEDPSDYRGTHGASYKQ